MWSNIIILSSREQVCLMRLRFERYFSHHRACLMRLRFERYFSHHRACLMRLRFERYFSHHRACWMRLCFERYFSHHRDGDGRSISRNVASFIKRTCSWRYKLIILWTLDTQVKIFLHICGVMFGKLNTNDQQNRWKIALIRNWSNKLVVCL